MSPTVFILWNQAALRRAGDGRFLNCRVTSPAMATLCSLLLSFYFIVAGLSKTFGSISLQFPSWGWSVASGAVSVALGVMLAMQWPTSATWFIGFAVGLDLILYGWALLMFAATVKKLSDVFA